MEVKVTHFVGFFTHSILLVITFGLIINGPFFDYIKNENRLVAIYPIATQGENIPPSNGGWFPNARIRPCTRIAGGFRNSHISSLLTHSCVNFL